MMLKKTVRTILLAITPTFAYPVIRNIVFSRAAHFLEKNTSLSFFSPQWNKVKSGPFAGIKVYYDPSANFWSSEAQDGMHDKEIFDFVLKKNLRGKTVFDIGAHIGFNTLCFAKLVGPKGNVVAFEPNVFNRERMEMNLSENAVLAKRITVVDYAVSNKNGTSEFLFTNAIEDGTSSGSAIASTKNEKLREQYENEFKYEKKKVKTISLDSYVEKSEYIPNLIKIDVEGAEAFVLEGARTVLRKYKPILLIELHTILNGHTVTALLAEYSYTFTTLQVEDDGRTFIAALPHK